MTTIPDTPSPYEDTAQVIRLDLQRLMTDVRGLTLLTPQQRRKFIVSGHVDEEFLRRMTLLIDAHPDIATMSQITSAEIRDHLRFSGAYEGVGEEMMLNGRKMVDTLTAERASVAERALRALKIARSVNTPAGSESLVPHLEAIDREFSRGRRKRAAAWKPEDAGAAAKKTAVKP
ncbi:MAG TPA: hypothetical protein VFP80_15855 [Thermoanaerobaculia bacterium]|nr:hypothetical protein [Thermoanaerobaculia bacterium]